MAHLTGKVLSTPLAEAVSCDEVYLDISGLEPPPPPPQSLPTAADGTGSTQSFGGSGKRDSRLITDTITQ